MLSYVASYSFFCRFSMFYHMKEIAVIFQTINFSWKESKANVEFVCVFRNLLRGIIPW